MSSQRPGELFPWPKRQQLTALDEVILAIPAAIVPGGEDFGTVVHCHTSVKIEMPGQWDTGPGAVIMIWLRAGQSVWLSKSCQAMVVPQSVEDRRVRRFAVTEASQQEA